MLYPDTPALVKLIRREPESDALADWLDGKTRTRVLGHFRPMLQRCS